MSRKSRRNDAATGLTPELVELAGLYGVQLHYIDAWGDDRSASPEAVAALLAALGAPLARPGDAREAIRARRRADAERIVEPVIVAWDGAATATELLLPRAAASGWVDCRLALEGPSGREVQSWKRSLDRLPTTGEREVAGAGYVRKRLPLPGSIPAGYHRLELAVAGTRRAATVISAPRRAYASQGERQWGIFLPLYALHRRDGLGLGDFGDLAALAEWTAGLGGGAIGTLPLLASFLDEPCEPSPYAPASRLFWNELYVDPRGLPELERSPAARRLLESSEFAAETAALAGERLVDYRRLYALKRPVLAALAESFFADAAEARRAAFEAFRERHPRLDDYAAFRAVGDRRREPWQVWPEPLRSGRIEAGDCDEADRCLHLYAQFAADEQLAAVAAAFGDDAPGLYLDLPLGVHPSSYDVWRERELFLPGVSAGAPPDLFFSRGQDWGFQPLHPGRLREDGYRYLAAALAHHLAHAGALRIDHVMQFHRLFCVPQGMSAVEGLYLEYPSEELWAVVCLESQRARARIVGENLGTVPEEVDVALAEHAIAGMFILQFEIDPSVGCGRFHRPVPANVAASLNSHDMPTFRAFLEGADIDDRLDLGLIDAEGAAEDRAARRRVKEGLLERLGEGGRLRGGSHPEVVAAVLETLADGAAPLVLVNLEDLWGELDPQNVPGTFAERPNWRRRARLSFEEFSRDPGVVGALRRVDEARRRGDVEEEAVDEELGGVIAVGAAGPPAGAADLGSSSPLTDDDLHLFNEGRHFRLADKLGCHPRTVGGRDGAHFAVWAPDAVRVSVVGDFNGWDRRSHPLGPRGSSGIWEGFIPGVEIGSRYKYHLESRFRGYRVDKADPFAVRSEPPPRTASVVWDLDYEWGDGAWMAARADRTGRAAPVSVYEVHFGSWRRVPEEGDRPLTYREMAPELARHVRELGFTHVEFLPLMEHPFYGSWGYQTAGYFAPTSRYGTPQDLMALVDHLHQEGVGVILDWVPSHFPTDEHGLGFFDGTHLYEHADPRVGFHPDWSSFIFNYGRNEVRSFLISSALFWLERFHVDGLRVDAVASMLYRDYSRHEGEWIPNVHGGRENLEAIDFIRQLNAEVYRSVPGAQTFAEESTSWPAVSRPTYVGGLGFGYKWDMGWMHDTLSYMAKDPIHRKFHHNQLTFRMMYAFSENFCLPLSHDEVVHGKGSLLAKMPGDDWQKLANLRLLLGYQWAQPGKKLLFMGGEFAQRREWSHEASLDWHLAEDPRHAGVEHWVADLNRLYRDRPALHRLDCSPHGFVWLDANDADNSVLAFVRRSKEPEDWLLFIFNFTPVPRYGYRVGAPKSGFWRELLNSDGEGYGGSGVGNLGGSEAAAEPLHGQPFSLALTLPPLAAIVLAPAEPAATATPADAEPGGGADAAALDAPEDEP